MEFWRLQVRQLHQDHRIYLILIILIADQTYLSDLHQQLPQAP